MIASVESVAMEAQRIRGRLLIRGKGSRDLDRNETPAPAPRGGSNIGNFVPRGVASSFDDGGLGETVVRCNFACNRLRACALVKSCGRVNKGACSGCAP